MSLPQSAPRLQINMQSHTGTFGCHFCSRGASGRESASNAGDISDTGLIPGLRRSRGEGHGNPRQYSGLENPTDRGAWRAAVHGVAERRPRLSSSSSSCCVKRCCVYSRGRVGLCERRAIVYPFRPCWIQGSFPLRAMMESAAVNVLLRRFALTHVHSSAGHALRVGETRPHAAEMIPAHPPR